MKATIEGRKVDIPAVWWENGRVAAIDQTKLPDEVKIVHFSNYMEVAEAIRNMTVRGAPTIGATGAYGVALAAEKGDSIEKAANTLKATRPTAYDLFYGVDWMLDHIDDPVESAKKYADDIIDRCRKIGTNGEKLIDGGSKILTHCNAGALATVDYGTALAPMRAAKNKGRYFFVFVDETRPRLQGANLTSWELMEEGIDHAIIPDNAAGHYMKSQIDLVITGSDRIAANGDAANKIGTYEKAVLAKENGVPFYIAAPISTFDPKVATGDDIPIEERPADEVLRIGDERIGPRGAKAMNPAFDVTPARYITGIITEIGILKPSEVGKIHKSR